MLLSAVAVLLVIACAPRSVAGEAANREDPGERQSSFFAALAAKDVEQTVAHFAEDATLQVAGMPPIRGRAAIQQFYGNVFRFLSATTPTSESVRVSGGGDMAYSIGSVTNVFEGEDGRVEYAGKYLLIWERGDAEWFISAYTISSNQPDGTR